MRQFLIESLKQIKCALTGHDVSMLDEENLFKCSEGYINTKCLRCEYPLLLRRDPGDKEERTYMLMERD